MSISMGDINIDRQRRLKYLARHARASRTSLGVEVLQPNNNSVVFSTHPLFSNALFQRIQFKNERAHGMPGSCPRRLFDDDDDDDDDAGGSGHDHVGQQRDD